MPCSFHYSALITQIPLLMLFWRIDPSLRPSAFFKFLWPGGVKTSPNLPRWKITAYWLFMTAYSIYLQLPSVSAGSLLQLQCDDAPCLGDSDPLASHHTHAASILYTEYKHHYHWKKFLEKFIFIASFLIINSWMGSHQESSTFPQCFLFHFLLKSDHAIRAAGVQHQTQSSLLGRCTILPTTEAGTAEQESWNCGYGGSDHAVGSAGQQQILNTGIQND